MDKDKFKLFQSICAGLGTTIGDYHLHEFYKANVNELDEFEGARIASLLTILNRMNCSSFPQRGTKLIEEIWKHQSK